MILTGDEIGRRVRAGEIVLEPFDSSQLNPNSYDLRLGARVLRYTGDLLDPRQLNETEEVTIPETGLVLDAGSFHIGHTLEWLGSKQYVPLLHARLSTACAGLFIHVTANLIDIGSIGNYSFFLHAARSVRIYPSMRIAQVSFWHMHGPVTLYDGKYQGAVGPASSQSYKDFG